MNIFDKPAEQPLMNTYVPVPWEHVFKLVDYGNSQVAAGQSAKNDVLKSLKGFEHISNPEELEIVNTISNEYMTKMQGMDQTPNLIEKARKYRDVQMEFSMDPRLKALAARKANAGSYLKQKEGAQDKIGGHAANTAPFTLEDQALATKGTFSKKEDGSYDWDNPYLGKGAVEFTPYTDIDKEMRAIGAAYQESDIDIGRWGGSGVEGMLARAQTKGVPREKVMIGFGIIPDAYKPEGYTAEQWEQKKNDMLWNHLNNTSEASYMPQLRLEANAKAPAEMQRIMAEMEKDGASAEEIRAAMPEIKMQATKNAVEREYLAYANRVVDQYSREHTTISTHDVPGFNARVAHALDEKKHVNTAQAGSTSYYPMTNPYTGAPVITVTGARDNSALFAKKIEETKQLLARDEANNVTNSKYASELASLERAKEVSDSWAANLDRAFTNEDKQRIAQIESKVDQAWAAYQERNVGREGNLRSSSLTKEEFASDYISKNLDKALGEKYKAATSPMLVSTHMTQTYTGTKTDDEFMKQAMFQNFMDKQFLDKATGAEVTEGADKIVEKAYADKLSANDIEFLMPVVSGTSTRAELYGVITVGGKKYMIKAPEDAAAHLYSQIGPGAEGYYTDYAHAQTLPSSKNAAEARANGAYLPHTKVLPDGKTVREIGGWVNIGGRPQYVTGSSTGPMLIDPQGEEGVKRITEKYNYTVR